MEDYLGRLMSNIGLSMFVRVPLFAPALMFVYRNRRMVCTEHLVLAALLVLTALS